MDETFSLNGFVCCKECQHHGSCLLQWVRGERGLPHSCCSLCQHAASCYESIEPSMRVDDDPVSAQASEEERMALSLASHAYLCCPLCATFSQCEMRQRNLASHRTSHCCPQCTDLKSCFEQFKPKGISEGLCIPAMS